MRSSGSTGTHVADALRRRQIEQHRLIVNDDPAGKSTPTSR
jgi:hypothetical protein